MLHQHQACSFEPNWTCINAVECSTFNTLGVSAHVTWMGSERDKNRTRMCVDFFSHTLTCMCISLSVLSSFSINNVAKYWRTPNSSYYILLERWFTWYPGNRFKQNWNLAKPGSVWNNYPRNPCRHAEHFRGARVQMKTDMGPTMWTMWTIKIDRLVTGRRTCVNIA